YQGKPFRMDEHLRRLERSLREVRIAGADIEILNQVSEDLIKRNDLSAKDTTIYIQITRGAAPRKHAFPEQTTPPTVYMTVSPLNSSQQKIDAGVKVILVPDNRWARCDIKSVALLPNVLANQQASEQGAEEAVFVRDGAITEGSHSNFCSIFDGELVTYPRSNYILGGITRQVVLELCGKLGIPVREFPILQKDLRLADELFLSGTTTEVLPVVQVDDWVVGDGKPGPITRKLQKAFREII
ncbi:MAG TPA: aminotransferase class IV, partial [Anaerolineae bacterium]